MSALTDSSAWRALADHALGMSTDFSAVRQAAGAGLSLDYSKSGLDDRALDLLFRLARQQKIEDRRISLLTGEKINTSEGRAAWHTALRCPDPPPDARDILNRLSVFCNQMHQTGMITDIVNIGIGGSSLGPQLAVQALSSWRKPAVRAHFVSNVEGSALQAVLQGLNPATTLFVIVSKTFTTPETMLNAGLAKQWLESAGVSVDEHIVAASSNVTAAAAFGIHSRHVFPFQDWVGGRYSVWSSAGMTVPLTIGFSAFRDFLSGAHAMDEHFRTAPLPENVPVLLALMGIWQRNFLHRPAAAVIPYHAALARFPAWLQQVDMESNGKSVDCTGRPVDYATGPLIFGEPGTDAQHSFFQWLHQGTDVVPVDFIVIQKKLCGTDAQQSMLLANVRAQAEALAYGRANVSEPHRHFHGGRPSHTIRMEELNPHSLGALMALYEHKVFVQGAVWNINSFDQFGVELGKDLARTFLSGH